MSTTVLSPPVALALPISSEATSVTPSRCIPSGVGWPSACPDARTRNGVTLALHSATSSSAVAMRPSNASRACSSRERIGERLESTIGVDVERVGVCGLHERFVREQLGFPVEGVVREMAIPAQALGA